MAAPPAFAAPTAWQPGIHVLYCVERGVNAGTYVPAKIVAQGATWAADGAADLQYAEQGSLAEFYIPAAKYSAATLAGTWKPLA